MDLGPYEKEQVMDLARQRKKYEQDAKIWKQGNVYIVAEMRGDPGNEVSVRKT